MADTTIAITGTLKLDQTAGLQDNDFNISSTLAELSDRFENFLNGTAVAPATNIPASLALDAAQKTFAATAEAAKTGATYVTVTPGTNATIDDLFFSNPSGNLFTGEKVTYDHDGLAGTPKIDLKTINGDSVFLHSYDDGDIVLATTSATPGSGEVVAAFYLNEAANHLTAGIEMVTFIALAHPDAANPDDSINWSDLLNVTAAGSLDFDFNLLKPSSYLWAAVGTSDNAVLVTGKSLDVDGDGKVVTNTSDRIHASNGGDGTTIGVNNQLFDSLNEAAVFTLVEGLDTLGSTATGLGGDYVVDPDGNPDGGSNKNDGINYDGYTNVGGASLFLSQSQGNDPKNLEIGVFEAGGGTAAEDGFNYIGTEPSGAFNNDTPVPVATVTIYDDDGDVVGTWVIGTDPDGAGPLLGNGVLVNDHVSTNGTADVRVTIGLNDANAANNHIIDVTGLLGGYIVEWTVAAGETFNRFQVKAEGGQFDVGKVAVSEGLKTTVPVGDKLFVDDDFPVLSGTNVSKQVDEDAMTGAGGGDLSTGIVEADDGDGGVENDEVTYSHADLAPIVNVGTDAPASFSLNLLVSGAVKDIDGNAMTSKGAAITWSVNGSVIEAVAGGRVIFTITQTAGADTPTNPLDDVFTVDLKDQIDHPNASGDLGIETLDLTPAFLAKDADGDPADLDGAAGDKEPIQLIVENDIPVVNNNLASIQVDEDAMTGAGGGDLSTGIVEADDGDGGVENDEATWTNAALQAVIGTGADEPVVFGLNTSAGGGLDGDAVLGVDGLAVFSKGEQVFYNVNGAVIEGVAGGRVVFTITQTAGDGTATDPTDDAFTFDLKDQIDHAANGDLGTRALDLTAAFTATDRDGDAADLNGAADDKKPIQVVVENDVPAVNNNIASARVEEDELSTSASPADFSNGITDSDGDDDEDILDFSELSPVVTAGADEPVSFSLDLDGSINGTAVKDIDGNAMTSKGTAITWNVNGSVIEAKAGSQVIFTVTQATGTGTPNDPTDDTFAIDLRDQIDHPNASGDDGVETINLTPAFNALDKDGDAADLDGAAGDKEPIQLIVENDIPVVNNNLASIQVDEDAMTGAGGGDLSTGIVEADDGDGGVENDEAVWLNAALQNVIGTGADEPVVFGLNTSAGGGLDGDPVLGVDGLAVFSKGAQVFYNVNGSVIEGVADGRVVFTITQTAGDGTATDPSDDAFTFDLKDQIDHAANGDLGTRALDLTAAFTAADRDGDAADLNGAADDKKPIQVVVENDVAALNGSSVTKHVDEDNMRIADGDLSNGNEEFGAGGVDINDGDGTVGEQDEVSFSQADLQGVVNSGADEPALFGLSLSASGAVNSVNTSTGVTTPLLSKGQAVTWSVSGGVVQGVTGASTPADLTDDRVVFTITRNANGAGAADDTFTVNLLDQLDHAASAGDLGLLTLDVTPAFSATDFDGDAIDLNGAAGDQEPIRVEVENDVPKISSQILGGAVDFLLNDTVTNSLNGLVGADDNSATGLTRTAGLFQYEFTSWTTPTNVFPGLTAVLQDNGTKITYYSTNVAANQNATTAVYEITLNQTANGGAGSYTFKVLQPPPQAFIPFDFTDLPSGQNLFGGIAVDKLDLSKGGLLVIPTNPVLNADGTMTNTSGTVNTSKGGGPVTIGNTNQAFNSTNEGALFIYVDNPLEQMIGGRGLDQNNADDADTIRFNGTNEVKIASVEIVQASGKGTASSPGPNMQITAYDINPGDVNTDPEAKAIMTSQPTVAQEVNIVGVKIYNSSGVLIEYRTNTGAGATNTGALHDLPSDVDTVPDASDDSLVGITFVMDSSGVYSVQVTNLQQNYTIEWETATNHDAAKVQHMAGSYDIGGFNLFQGQDTVDQEFDFSVKITDWDEDSFGGAGTVLDDFHIKVDGTGVHNDPLVG